MNTTPFYIIVERDNGIQDGEAFTDWRDMLASLAYADFDAVVLKIDRAAMTVADVTDAAAKDLYAERFFFGADGREFLEYRFPSPYTQADYDADKADARRHEVMS